MEFEQTSDVVVSSVKRVQLRFYLKNVNNVVYFPVCSQWFAEAALF